VSRSLRERLKLVVEGTAGNGLRGRMRIRGAKGSQFGDRVGGKALRSA